jgi:DNA helicase-2/ATP-dependent DNA helicase PcrA
VTDAAALLEGLDPEQREVATALSGPVRVLAGAGTGKTRAITHRIAYAVKSDAVSVGEVLAVTFTTRAAGEMRTRLAALGVGGVQARTFHSAALRQARFFWPQVYGSGLPRLVESKLSMVSEAVHRAQLHATQADLRDLAGEIEWAKVSNVTPDTYPTLASAAGRRLADFDESAVGKVYRAYEDVKTDRRCIDMEDTMLCALAVLTDDERAAAQFRKQYRWFVVDEFQDVSPLQFALLRQWLGTRAEVCVVGDPAQTIYSFAGAQARLLLEFPRVFAGTTSVELIRNYRSTPQVIETANAVMRGDPGHGAVALRATRTNGPAVSFRGYGDEVEEADQAAEQIEKLIVDGVAPSEIAVLFRINAISEIYEDELSKRGIPVVVRGAERFFERAEIREAMSLLRSAARTEEFDGSLGDAVRTVLSSAGWTPTAPAGRGRVRDRWESLQALVDLAADDERTLPAFVAGLEERAAAQHAPGTDGVTLGTLHAAKGLEWTHVFLVGVNDGSIPITYAETQAAIAEERRLLYVGITRARDRLCVSWAAARNPGGRGSRQPSRFLRPLLDPAKLHGASARARSSRRSTSVAQCRVCGRALTDPRERKLARCTTCPADYDEDIFEQLRAWRRDQAASEQMPAYCVFTDATLTALAEMRPSDAVALLRVPGIGKVKIDKYGSDVLALVNPERSADGHG